jgi:hypothetical protein
MLRQLYELDPEQAQLCGLFCHVGIPVMLQLGQGELEQWLDALQPAFESVTSG